MKAFAKYSVARLALLLATYLVLWLVLRSFAPITPGNPYLLLSAIIVSAFIALFALRGMRDDVAAHLQARSERVRRQVEESRHTDDVD